MPGMTTSDIHFQPEGKFYGLLKKRVDRYFAKTGLSPRDVPSHYLKIVFMVAWSVASYLLLLFWAQNWWEAGLLTISLALAINGMILNLGHDANHGGLSRFPWVNRLMAISMDAIGASSYFWRWVHNSFHHSYTNISGVDSDIDLEPLLRVAPDQELLPQHRFQQFYCWPAYSLLLFKWHFVRDFTALAESGENGIPKPSMSEMFILFGGKFFYLAWTLLIPMLFRPAWQVILVYVAFMMIWSFVIAITFQLAHLVKESKLYPPQPTDMDSDWASHQVYATCNFAPTNRFISWYVGGLNHQIEHHLFPFISHVHYDAISPIVQKTCKEFKLPYHSHKTLAQALASHFEHMREMGLQGREA